MWSKIWDYYNRNTRLFTKTQFCRELKMLQNCVFFLKLFIDFKEIANDIIITYNASFCNRSNNLDTNCSSFFQWMYKTLWKSLMKKWIIFQISDILYCIWSEKIWSGFGSDHVLTKCSQIYFIRSESCFFAHNDFMLTINKNIPLNEPYEFIW